jgi:hypothetical protein
MVAPISHAMAGNWMPRSIVKTKSQLRREAYGRV